MTPVVAPASPVVIPAIDVVDDHRSIAMSFPMLPVAVAEPLYSHHPGSMPLYNNPAHRAAVAGITIIYHYPPGNRAAANHDFCRNALRVKRSCHQRQTCNQRPCTSAGLHIGLDWWTGELHPPEVRGSCQYLSSCYT